MLKEQKEISCSIWIEFLENAFNVNGSQISLR